MDQAAFTRQLSAWLDPWRLASLAQQDAKDRGALERPAGARREAWRSAGPRGVGRDRLTQDFPGASGLSPGFLSLLPRVSRVPLDEGALARLSGLRFTGSVSFDDFEPSSPAGTV